MAGFQLKSKIMQEYYFNNEQNNIYGRFRFKSNKICSKKKSFKM